MSRRKILITSALPYANGPLHFGHIAGAYLPADCYARFQRLRGSDVLYLCGSDEYGIAITLSAEIAGRSPQEHVDFFHHLNQKLFQSLYFSFDYYGRTTSPAHAELTQKFFRVLQEKGLIEEREENHLFSESENRFLADRYVVGICPQCGYEEARGDECPRCAASYEAIDLNSPRSKLTGAALILKPSRHLYLRFDLCRQAILEWLQTKTDWKENVLHFAISYAEKLKARAITRDSNWGIPVPGHPGKVFYVWFDAPIGYISIAQEWAKESGNPEAWKDFWLNAEAKLVQFIGKDNIPFHAVFFPIVLMSQDLPYKLPDELPANEFFLLEGKQFSKSDRWMIDLENFFSRYSADQARYAIAANAPETADAEFSWKDFQMRCNIELLGKLGNFIHRTLTFAQKQCEGVVPPLTSLREEDRLFFNQINCSIDKAASYFETFQLRKASQSLIELAQIANVYFDTKKPWILAKDPKRHVDLQSTIAHCLNCIKALALIASPIIPKTAQTIWEMLGFSTELEKQSWVEVKKMTIPEGKKLPSPAVLFKKVEDEEILSQMDQLRNAHTQSENKMEAPLSFEPLKEVISYELFASLDLRVAQILEAQPIPKSKKLLKLKVDMGFEQRTIVSGIAHSYKPEELIGKKVMIVANLAPATIFGIESCGMVLCGAEGNSLELPCLERMPPGSSVS